MYCSSEISANCPCWEILLACYAMEYLASAGPGAGPLEDVILIFLAAVSLEAPRRAPRAASHAGLRIRTSPHVGRSVEASHKMYGVVGGLNPSIISKP
jgi:hypothetical protein